MSRSKRRNLAWLPIVYPVKWTAKVGDRVLAHSPYGDPRIASTPLKSAFVVPYAIGLLSDFIQVEPITRNQFSALEASLRVTLTKAVREEIDAAICRLVTSVALSAQIHHLDEFRARLKKIIEHGQNYINAAEQFARMTDPRSLNKRTPNGGLSVDQAEKKHVFLAGFRDRISNVNIEAILDACRCELNEINSRPSKPGVKSDVALISFLRTIQSAAQHSNALTKLPSNQIREKYSTSSRTPFFEFARECMRIAVLNGRTAIASLPDDEKSRAEEIFVHFEKYTTCSKKADGAFLARLRRMVSSAHGPRRHAPGPRQTLNPAVATDTRPDLATPG